jgi:hypothetical protein
VNIHTVYIRRRTVSHLNFKRVCIYIYTYTNTFSLFAYYSGLSRQSGIKKMPQSAIRHLK